jgi:hypothetical protein
MIPPEPHPGFKAQNQKPSTGGFEAQPTKPLDACHRRPGQPNHQVFQSLRSTCPSAILSWSTWSPTCTLALVDDPRCQPPMVGHLASLVPQSKPPVSILHCSRSISTDPLDVHLRHRPQSPSSAPAHHNSRDMLHNTNSCLG